MNDDTLKSLCKIYDAKDVTHVIDPREPKMSIGDDMKFKDGDSWLAIERIELFNESVSVKVLVCFPISDKLEG